MMLVETMASRNFEIENLKYHNRRFNRSRKEVFNVEEAFDLSSIIKPEYAELLKWRIEYNEKIQRVSSEVYKRRKIESLKLVYDDTIEYGYKYEDRTALVRLFKERGDCDDVLIVKNGLVTDTSSANAAFFDGKQWYTPSSPLLRGTRRESLLDSGVIQEREIRADDLADFQKASVFNCMIRFGEIEVYIEKVFNSSTK